MTLHEKCKCLSIIPTKSIKFYTYDKTSEGGWNTYYVKYLYDWDVLKWIEQIKSLDLFDNHYKINYKFVILNKKPKSFKKYNEDEILNIATSNFIESKNVLINKLSIKNILTIFTYYIANADYGVLALAIELGIVERLGKRLQELVKEDA